MTTYRTPLTLNLSKGEREWPREEYVTVFVNTSAWPNPKTVVCVPMTLINRETENPPLPAEPRGEG